MEIWKIGNPVHTYEPPIHTHTHTHTLMLKYVNSLKMISVLLCVYIQRIVLLVMILYLNMERLESWTAFHGKYLRRCLYEVYLMVHVDLF